MAKRNEKSPEKWAEEWWADESKLLDFVKSKAEGVDNKSAKRQNQKFTVALAKDSLYLGQLEHFSKEVFKDKIIVPKLVLPKKKYVERELNLILSDLHFGSLLDPREVPARYGPHEEARRLAAVCVQTAEYKKQYRDETKLRIHLLGDLIHGRLHDPSSGAPLAEQICATAHLLAQAIAYLASQFPNGVIVETSPGNHDRILSRHRDRATDQKFDSNATTVYFFLKKLVEMSPLKQNVTVNLNYSPYYTYNSFDKRGFATHGDTVLKPGNPGKLIDVEKIRRQVNERNAVAIKAGQKPFSLFFCGHVHVATLQRLPNDIEFITNGCLIPTDAYGESEGYIGTTCGQQLWESVPGHMVGDSRFIKVNEDTDKDASLEKIIKPYLGL